MYIPPAFKTDDTTAWAFVRERGFGTLIAVDAGRPVASHVPFLVEGRGGAMVLACHVARSNPLLELISRAPGVLVAVTGPDAYISPDWYTSADQVPTWNYISVHLYGTSRLLAQGEMLAHVDALSAQFEARLAPKPAWTSAKMTAGRREAMLKAIVGLEIAVERVEAQWKLGQHKSKADQAGVLSALSSSPDASARALGAIIAARNSA